MAQPFWFGRSGPFAPRRAPGSAWPVRPGRPARPGPVGLTSLACPARLASPGPARLSSLRAPGWLRPVRPGWLAPRGWLFCFASAPSEMFRLTEALNFAALSHSISAIFIESFRAFHWAFAVWLLSWLVLCLAGCWVIWFGASPGGRRAQLTAQQLRDGQCGYCERRERVE